MNKQSVNLPGAQGQWGSYISKYQPDSSKVLDNMFTANSKNFVTDQTGMIQKRQGGVQWNRTSFPEPAKDTYEAVFESGARHFLRIGGGVLSASTGTGLFDVITSGYSALGNFEWATYQNRSYGCNGINPPQVYDIATSYGGVNYSFTTAKTKIMGAQAPITAPTAAAPTSGGAIPLGPHTYKVTFVYYESEESNGSLASAVQTTTGGNQTIALSAIPIGGYGVTARNVYRDNNDGVYLLLDTIANNTATTYTDVLLIGGTPTPMPLTNDVPPVFSKIALWMDALFISPTGETNLIRFSNAGAPDVFDPDHFVTCQSDDVVTALYVYNGKLYVFGLHSFGSIEGNTPDTFYYHNISNLVGCVDNRSIQVRSIVSVPTLWWLSDKGFYYSNGNTVEYGSDYIQDLVNLNLAQVSYSINKNTQTSYADFSGDTKTPGIDIDSNLGAVTTLNPLITYDTKAEWEGGSSLTNVKTSDGDNLEVPTLFAPSISAGTLGGDAVIGGAVVTLPTFPDFTGEDNRAARPNVASTSGTYYVAQSIKPSKAGTITGLSIITPKLSFLSGLTAQFYIYDTLGGSQLFAGPLTSTAYSTPTFGDVNVDATPTLYVTAGQQVTVICKFIQGATTASLYGSSGFEFAGVTDAAKISLNLTSGYGPLPGGINTLRLAYSFSQASVSSSGTWSSPIYDSGSATGVSSQISVSGSYPTGTTGSVTVQGSNDPTMATYATQTISVPNGTYSLSLSGYRYWRGVLNLSTITNTVAPNIGSITLRFDSTAAWVSQPIDATIDNTGWSALIYSGNVPLGTSVTLTIATSTNNITYSSFGPVGSAAVARWAKVKVTLTTDSGNSVSPSISSVTLSWALSSTITSSIIDSGTTPAGFNVFQWEQAVLGVGTVTSYLRTAASVGGIPGASWVAVANGEFPSLSALRYIQWKAVLTSTANLLPTITSVTVSWFIGTQPSAPTYLGSASTYAVLGHTAVTNTGSSVLTGDVGNVNASSITGFPPGTFSGTLHDGDAAAGVANTDATNAFVMLAALSGFIDISAVDLGSHTLTPGSYSYSSSATWTAGALTLDAGGNANAIWVIKTGSTLITPSAASVTLANGAQAANVYWVVGSSATLGTTTAFKGNIIANISITCNTGATCTGSLIALTGAVTLDTLIGARAIGIGSTGSTRVASIFFNKTYSISVATLGATANNTLIQLDQFGNWRVQKDTSIGTFLSYFNTLYFTDGITDLIYNGFIANTDNGTAIVMDVRTKAWNAENDLFLKVPRAFKVTGINTGATLRAYYSKDRGASWVEMLNEQGSTGYITTGDGSEFVTLFVPDATTLNSGRTLMYRLVSSDVYPCSIINYVPSFYSRKGRYLANG